MKMKTNNGIGNNVRVSAVLWNVSWNGLSPYMYVVRAELPPPTIIDVASILRARDVRRGKEKR